MRLLLSIYILTFTNFCFGQDFNLVETETEAFYKVLKDSLDLNLNFPDGRYKIFLTDTHNLPSNVFYVRNGSVDGPYLELTSGGWTYGNYSQDSLWTFLTASDDTTHKIGTWRHHIYGIGVSIGDKYKMPFDTNDRFTEIWRFHNGQMARKATFKKDFGIEIETYWDFESNQISKQTINSGTKIYYQSITYKNDSISNVSIIQNGLEFNLNFDYRFFLDEPSFNIQVYSDDWARTDLPITTLTINNSKTLTDFSDVKRQFFLRENVDGNISIEYITKNGKRKYKTLKVK